MRAAPVSVALAVLTVVSVSAVQYFVTSPGVVTFTEFRLSLLSGAPALVITLTAHWVDAGARPFDTRDDR